MYSGAMDTKDNRINEHAIKASKKAKGKKIPMLDDGIQVIKEKAPEDFLTRGEGPHVDSGIPSPTYEGGL